MAGIATVGGRTRMAVSVCHKVRCLRFLFGKIMIEFSGYLIYNKNTPYGLRSERVTVLFLSFVSNHWRKLLFPLIAVLAMLVFLFVPRGQAGQETVLLSEQFPIEENQSEEMIEDEQVEAMPTLFIVDVKGAVMRPGVYTLEEGDRLIDAIDAAGGYLAEADTRLVNHALKLSDEMLIYIPVEGEEPLEESMVIHSAESSSDQGGKINLNTASESELTTLTGIGPAKAAAIIQYREDEGLFQSPEELMKISGIGQKTFEKLESAITVK